MSLVPGFEADMEGVLEETGGLDDALRAGHAGVRRVDAQSRCCSGSTVYYSTRWQAKYQRMLLYRERWWTTLLFCCRGDLGRGNTLTPPAKVCQCLRQTRPFVSLTFIWRWQRGDSLKVGWLNNIYLVLRIYIYVWRTGFYSRHTPFNSRNFHEISQGNVEG